MSPPARALTRHPHTCIGHRGGQATAANHRQSQRAKAWYTRLKQKPPLTRGFACPRWDSNRLPRLENTGKPRKHKESEAVQPTCDPFRRRKCGLSTPSFAPEMGPTRRAGVAGPGMPTGVNWLVPQRPPALTCRKNGSRPLPRRTQELLMCSGLWTFRRFQSHSRASSQLFQPARYREPEQFDICSSS